MIVYVVLKDRFEDGECDTVVSGVYSSKEKADAFAEEMNGIHDKFIYYVSESFVVRS